jgi:hypothetical protein
MQDDIAVIMRRRAVEGYGFSLDRNESICAAMATSTAITTVTTIPALKHLHRFWKQFAHVKLAAATAVQQLALITPKGKTPTALLVDPAATLFPGVLGLLTQPPPPSALPAPSGAPSPATDTGTISSSQSASASLPAEGVLRAVVAPTADRPMVRSFPVVTSAGRHRALRVCGWWPLPQTAADWQPIDAHINALEAAGEYERAAAIALFYLDLHRAVHVMTLSGQAVSSTAAAAASASSASLPTLPLLPASVSTTYPAARRAQSLPVSEHHHDYTAMRSSSIISLSSTAPMASADLSLSTHDAVEEKASAPSHGNASAGTASGPPLSFLAVALAGFPDHDGRAAGTAAGTALGANARAAQQLWRHTVAAVQPLVTHPYLRALLAFVCAGDHDVGAETSNIGRYAHVLDAGMDLADAVAFALRFLPDNELLGWLEARAITAVMQADLEGLLLTGLGTTRGSELLQAYVDATADVQTAAILAAHVPTVPAASTAPPADASRDVLRVRADAWLYAYRSLLDAWKLWHVRAKFDTSRAVMLAGWGATGAGTSAGAGTGSGGRPTTTQVTQVFARCQYCNSSLSLPRLMDPTLSAPAGTGAARRAGTGIAKLGWSCVCACSCVDVRARVFA